MPDRLINIKDLILEEPERARELPFDPDKEITREEWDKMKKELVRRKEKKEWGRIASFAAEMKLLFPHREQELFLDNASRVALENNFKKRKLSDTTIDASFVRDFQILFPQYTNPLKENLHKRLRKTFQIFRKQGEWGMNSGGGMDVALSLKLLFPQEESFQSDEEMVEWCKEDISYRHQQKQWEVFAQKVMTFRLLFPDHFRTLRIRDDAWDGMRLHLQRQKEMWDAFCRHAVAMKIIAADEARIDDQGLIEITMRKPKQGFAPPTPPMPEVRRF